MAHWLDETELYSRESRWQGITTPTLTLQSHRFQRKWTNVKLECSQGKCRCVSFSHNRNFTWTDLEDYFTHRKHTWQSDLIQDNEKTTVQQASPTKQQNQNPMPQYSTANSMYPPFFLSFDRSINHPTRSNSPTPRPTSTQATAETGKRTVWPNFAITTGYQLRIQ